MAAGFGRATGAEPAASAPGALPAGGTAAARAVLPRVHPLVALRRRMDDALMCVAPGLGEAHVGIYARPVGSNRPIFERDSHQSFIPASNGKLFSMAFALSALGPDFQFETLIGAARKPDANGVLADDLIFKGGGDPSFCARRNLGLESDPMRALEQMADQVVAAGVRAITGDVVGDETRYDRDLYPVGWTVDDATWSHGSPVSALTVYESQLDVRIEGAADPSGSPEIFVKPIPDYFAVENRLTTGERTRVSVERMPGTRQLIVSGTVVPGAKTGEQVAVDDPALFAAAALKDALERRGVRVGGGLRTVSREAGATGVADVPLGVVFASAKSAPLIEILRVVGKTSRNLYAEATLREAGLRVTGVPDRNNAVSAMTRFLATAGGDEKCCFFQDGSGLSRQTLVTPVSTVALLDHMYRGEHKENWLSVMPVGARDGTLAYRMRRSPEARRVRAKTGAIAHVATISGYVNSKTWGEVAFAAMINNFTGDSGEAWRLLDKISLALAE